MVIEEIPQTLENLICIYNNKIHKNEPYFSHIYIDNNNNIRMRKVYTHIASYCIIIHFKTTI